MIEHDIIKINGIVPSKSNSYKIITLSGHGSLAKTPRLKEYEKQFYLQIGHYRDLDIRGFFEIYVDVYYKANRADLDNAMKIILDCLQKTNTIENDNKCTKIVARKFVDKENPRVELKIIEVD